MPEIEEKNIFLQELEHEHQAEKAEKETRKEKKPKKTVSATAIFAATVVFFLFIAVLLIFVLSLSGTGNPFFTSFGIEAYDVKNFLKSLVNNTFLVFIIVLLLSTAIGIFRGYMTEKEEKKKRRGSFMFGTVSGGLIFLSVLAWGGALAFVENFVVEEVKKDKIEIVGFEDGRDIIAPLDIEFSAKDIAKNMKRQGKLASRFRWSKDDGKNFTAFSLQDTVTMQFFTQGKQKIILEIETTKGDIIAYERSFSVDSATFSVSPQVISVNKKVVFSAKNLVSDGKIYKWDFNSDGIYDSSIKTSEVSHVFLKPGKQTVTLRAEKKNDIVEEFTKEIFIQPEAEKEVVAEFTANKELKGKAPFEVSFDASSSFSKEGEIESFVWSISGERSKKKGSSISHIFEKEGVYTIALEVENSFSQKDIKTLEVQVLKGNSAPTAEISTVPKKEQKTKKVTKTAPFTLSFSAENSIDPDEDITRYSWTLLDSIGATVEEFNGSNQEYIFRDKGEYILSLSVLDSQGEKDTKNLEISVLEPVVSSVLRASPKTGTLPLIVEFNASESSCKKKGCEILSFEWDFNDGSPVVPAGAHISHQFSKTGTFEVEMTAITNEGEKSSAVQYITVTDPPFTACFTTSRSKGSAPLVVVLDPTTCSKGNIAKYEWDFGDGYVSSQKKPRHTYEKPGVYTPILKIFDENGRVSTTTKTITVSE